MRKQLAVEHVRIGMHIVELDIDWLKSPFWRKRFTVKTEKEMRLLREYCKTVFIDIKECTPASLAHLRRKKTTPVARQVKPQNLEPAQQPLTQDPPTAEEIPFKDRKGLLAVPELLSRKELQKIELHIGVCVNEIKDVFTRISNGDTVNCENLTNAVKRLTDDALNDAGSLLLISRLQERELSLAEKSVNVCILTIAFAQYLQLNTHKTHVLGLGALLHDVGMLKVPEYLLNHEGPLNKAQRQAIEYHVIEGLSFVGLHDELSGIRELRDIIGNHHERYDGSGYPKGLKGDKIPYMAQILGITSTYEAMTRERFYSGAASPTQALSKMYSWRSTLFDARLVHSFIKALGVYPPGCMVELEDQQVAVVTAINPENRTRPVIRILTGPASSESSYADELNLMRPELAHMKISRTLEGNDIERLNIA